MYLEQLQFNINVLSSVYAKYYFDLRSLAEDNGLSFPSEYEPLTKERAKKLEVQNLVLLMLPWVLLLLLHVVCSYFYVKWLLVSLNIRGGVGVS